MNTQILKKCLTELESATPRIDYVKGMLETLIEMQPEKSVNNEYLVADGSGNVRITTPEKEIANVKATQKDSEIAAMDAIGAKGKKILEEAKKEGQLQ